MPNASGQYMGDYATILPDNNQSMMHIYDRLQQAEAQKAAAAAAAQKEDAARRYRLGSYIGNRLNAKNLFSGTAQDPNISGIVSKAQEDAYDALLKGADEVDIMQQVNDAAGKAALLSAKSKEINKSNTAQIAAITKQYPGIDPVALAEVMGHDSFYKQDEKGNWILKDPEEIDQNGVDALELIRMHPDKVIKKGAGISAMVKGMKLEDVGEPSEYNPFTGKRTKIGYKGKIPTEFIGYSDDGKGNMIPDVKHEDYKLPDGSVYIDPSTRKPVKVAAPDVFNRFMGRIDVAMDIEDDVRKDLKAINAVANGMGKPEVTNDGPMADMLRKKYLYDRLQKENQYKLIPEKDRTFDNMMKIKAKEISSGHLSLSRSIHQFNKDKASGKYDDNTQVPMFIDELDKAYGENVTDENGNTVRFVHGFDANDLLAIQGEAASPKDALGNTKKIIQPITIKTKDGRTLTGFPVNSKGNLVNADGTVIDKDRVQTDVLNSVTKETVKRAPVTIRGTARKVVNAFKSAVTPGTKVKGTKKKLY